MAIGTSNNTISTRIQLKSDTEANWKALNSRMFLQGGFKPLEGEIIIYIADSTHSYARLKVGDGVTNINDLKFIDAGTINGEVITHTGSETLVLKYPTFSDFPQPGDSNKLYVDLSTNTIYHYMNETNYRPLMDVSTTKTNIVGVRSWLAGRPATAAVQNNVLVLTDGIAPILERTTDISVVTQVRQGGIEV